MEQAASYTMHEQISHGVTAHLRLRQGSSARATWILEESPGGTMVTLGADPTCDWQVRAAFVPARACSVLLLGGSVYVRPGREGGVLLNGRPTEDDAWTEVPDGARVDIGLARFEVLTERHGAQYDTGPHFQAAPPRPHGYGYGQAEGEVSGAYERHTRGFDAVRELDSGTYPVSDESDGDRVPAVLADEDERRDRSPLWRYALAGVATACAYGGWIFLLDYI
jgi:hypothetical protein